MVRITKPMAEERLADVPDEVVFRCCDGRIFRNLKELRDALNIMEDRVYTHHVTEGKNDFSAWVRDIIGDQTLAKNLRNSLNREQAAKVVVSRIAFLESKLTQP